MEHFEMVLNDETKEGVFAISLVENPAIEEDFIKLSKIEVNLQVTNDERREVVGIALLPNKKILRRDEKGNEYTISFPESTIDKVQENYMSNLRLQSVTVDHESKVKGVCLIESWIVEDTANDKSNIYNLNAPKGSWIVKMKVYNDEVYNDIKLGKYKGFSIEGKFDDNQIDAKADVIEEIKQLLKKL